MAIHQQTLAPLNAIANAETQEISKGSHDSESLPPRRPKVSFDHNEFQRSETSEVSTKSRHGFFSEFELIAPPPLTSQYSLQNLYQAEPDKSKCKISSFLPILQWLPHYQRDWIKPDIMAGITVSILQVPQVLAYAVLAGLPPEWGLYASIVPVILYSIWSTSTKVAVGPGAPSAIMLASAVNAVVAKYDGENDEELYQSIAMTFTFCCGVVFITLGLLRAGFVVVFLSRPVMTGFIMSAALIIILSQCRSLMGLDIGRYPVFYLNLIAVIENISTIHWWTTIISVFSLILLFLPKWISCIPRWVPIPLIVMVLNILLSYFLDFESLGVKTIGAEIESGFPMPAMPKFEYFGDVFPSALVVTIVDYMSNIVLAKSFEQKAKNTHRIQMGLYEGNMVDKPIDLAPIDVDANMEFMAYGIANLFGSFFSSQLISASFSRTALNSEMNGQSRIAGLFRAVLCILCLLLLMPYLSPLPKCVLAAVVCTAVYRLTKTGICEMIFLWRVSKLELIEFCVVLIAPLLIGMEMGIFLAIGTSIIVNLLRHTFASVIFLGRLQTSKHDDVEYVDCHLFKEAKKVEHITIIEMKAELSFSNSLRLVDKIRDLLTEGNKYIVVSLNLTSFIDTSAIREIIVLFSDAKGSYICLSQCRPKVVQLIRRYQKNEEKFPDNVKTFVSTNDAVRYLEGIQKEQEDVFTLSSDTSDHDTSDAETVKVPISPTPKIVPVVRTLANNELFL